MDKCICDLKEGEEKLITIGDWVNLYILLRDKEYWLIANADGRAEMMLHYCPVCGRKLEEEVVYEDYSEYLK